MPPKGPYPRNYELRVGLHAMQRQAERDIPMPIMEDTVRTGSEKTLGKGQLGGTVRQYDKAHQGRKVVVIGELVGNVLHLITTYEKTPDISRN